MNKRDFVLSGCASLLGTGAWAGAAEGPAGTVPASAGPAHWQSQLGAAFASQTSPHDVYHLHEVRHIGRSADHEEFSLVFLAAAGQRERHAGSTLLRRADGSHVALYLEPMDNDPATGKARCIAHFSSLT